MTPYINKNNVEIMRYNSGNKAKQSFSNRMEK
jgi:hypothetical protein